MNAELRKPAKNDFGKDFFKLMDNSVFGKTMENIRNRIGMKLVITNKQRSKFETESNYNSTKYISKDLLIMEMKKVEVKMNRLIYLGQKCQILVRHLRMNFGIIILNRNMEIKQDYAI